MKRILVMVALLVVLLSGNAMALQRVQLHDDFTLYDLVQEYNARAENFYSNSFDVYMQMMFPSSFTQINESLVPYTTTYVSHNILSNATMIGSINGNGRVVCVAVVVPKTHSSLECSQLMAGVINSLDGGLPYNDALATCQFAMRNQDNSMIYSARLNRGYIVVGCNSDNYYKLAVTAAVD